MEGDLLKRLLGTQFDHDQPPEPMLDENPMHGDDKVLQLRLKKKRQLAMLKQMLSDSGYDDLAQMTTLSKHGMDDDL